jgi:hypothetical protein
MLSYQGRVRSAFSQTDCVELKRKYIGAKMARPKKKPDFNSEEVSQQVIEAITDAYLNPTEGMADDDGKMYVNLLADEFGMSRIKLRKILITSGAYETPTSRQVNELYKSGKTVKEIQTITGLSAASANGYLPYQKTIYNLEESTLLAERLRKFRSRKAAVRQLAAELNDGEPERIKETLWNTLVLFEGYPFKTAKGLRYYYTIRGNEIFFSRKEKSVTRASVSIAFETAMELQKTGTRITGPKMLRCFGASYLYPVFQRLGVIRDGEEAL